MEDKKVFFPPVGIVHMINHISDLIDDSIVGKKKVIVNTSSQPNSSPHLGTITTIMCAFALAQYVSNKYSVETEVLFDELENSPAKTFLINDKQFYLDQAHSYCNEVTNEEFNMGKFFELFDFCKEISKINYRVRRYNEFQANTYVRETLTQVVFDYDFFARLLSPKSKILHIRTLCPICGVGPKDVCTNSIEIGQKVIVKNVCPYHGEYSVHMEDLSEYIDINTQLRDLCKCVAFTKEDKINNTLTIMLDGSDWSGVWQQRVQVEGMVRLGYNEFPIRLFSPLILDWSGAKFSKSLYLEAGSYKNINDAFINYDNFAIKYGETGFKKLWNEIQTWISEPRRFFRHYSVEYFDLLFTEKVDA